jgi:hypothetical protein
MKESKSRLGVVPMLKVNKGGIKKKFHITALKKAASNTQNFKQH